MMRLVRLLANIAPLRWFRSLAFLIRGVRMSPTATVWGGRAQLQRAAELQSVHEARVIAQIGREGREQLLALLDRLSALPST